jgi:hypothetical protein
MSKLFGDEFIQFRIMFSEFVELRLAYLGNERFLCRCYCGGALLGGLNCAHFSDMIASTAFGNFTTVHDDCKRTNKNEEDIV